MAKAALRDEADVAMLSVAATLRARAEFYCARGYPDLAFELVLEAILAEELAQLAQPHLAPFSNES